MSRQARQAGEFLHIIVRGIGRQILFEDDADRRKYLFFLRKYSAENDITLLAYCLMENHVHLLIHNANGASPIFMKKMGISYAYYFNQKYDRSGHLFQDRYLSEVIGDDAYLLAAFRYILNNPQKAGICKASEYKWSSYHDYGKTNVLTDTKIVKELLGTESAFEQFMLQQDDAEYMEAEPRKRSDAWALSVIQNKLHVMSGTQLQQLDRQQRNEALVLLKKEGLSVRQLERLTGINRGVIQKA